MQHKVLVEGISEEVEEALKSFRMDTIYLQFDIITQKVLNEKIIQQNKLIYNFNLLKIS